MGAAGAALQRRVLISHDFQTMPAHFQEFVLEQCSPGVFLIPQDLPIWLGVDTLILVGRHRSTEWENRLCLIPSLVSLVVGGPAYALAN